MGRIKNAIRSAWRAVTGGVPTNYGAGALVNGTYVTFLRGADGVVRVQTPAAIAGCQIVRQADGRWQLV